jgi:hypothetical protein
MKRRLESCKRRSSWGLKRSMLKRLRWRLNESRILYSGTFRLPKRSNMTNVCLKTLIHKTKRWERSRTWSPKSHWNPKVGSIWEIKASNKSHGLKRFNKVIMPYIRNH